MNWLYEENRIYSVNDDNDLLAETTYVFKTKNEVIIDHTYVNPILRNQGIANKMLVLVMDHFKTKEYRVSATCSYANAWLKKHHEKYKDMISDGLSDEMIACKIG